MKAKNTIILGMLVCTSSAILASLAPIIITQPQSQTVNEGESVTFSVVAENGSNGTNDFTIPLSGSVNLDMIWIEPGTFIDETQHKVIIDKGYWLGKYEVTQAQFEAVWGDNPSSFQGADRPVEMVHRYGALGFCIMLTEQERAAGRLPEGYEYTLPTCEQWEYACRAGTTTDLNSGKNLSDANKCREMDEVGWYQYNSNDMTHPVGQKKPNAWGLYDMHGNVNEWCLDYEENFLPTGEISHWWVTSYASGGCWKYRADECRSASIHEFTATTVDAIDGKWSDTGFRVALVASTRTEVSAAADTLTYQWYKDGTAISGATASSYTIESAKQSDAGSYTVTVSNDGGSVTSDAAILTVKAKPETLSVHRDVSVTGNKAAVKLTISNAPKGYFGSLEETWQSKNVTFSNISNDGTVAETEDGMKVSWSGFDMSGNYQFPGTLTYTASVPEGTSGTVSLSGKLVITTPNGAVEVNIETMNVTFTTAPAAPVIVKNLENKTASEGSSVTFSVMVTGSEPLLYQWFKNSSLLSGVNGSSYTIPDVSSGDAGTYMVMVSNAQGAVMSNPATLTVMLGGIPELKLEPAGSGKWKITFTGTLQESTDMKIWTNVSGAQNGTYTFTPTAGKKFYRAAK